MRTLVSIVVVTFLFVAAALPVHAQSSHAASQSVLDAAVQAEVATGTADREAVERLLDRAEVKAVAGDLGLDLRRAQSAVKTLDDAQLAEVAAQASQIERALAGGQSSITISTTMIIIGLLVLILLIVAVG
jgi:hypothetical protein